LIWWFGLCFVQVGLIYAVVPPFLRLSIWHRDFGGPSLDKFRCLLWWVVSWRVPFWFVSGVWWANRFWFEIGS